MTDDTKDPRDEAIERIAAALRPLPPVDDAARIRVLVAVAADRQRAIDHAPRGRRIAMLGAVAALLVVTLGGSWLVGRSRFADPVPSRRTAPASAATLAANDASIASVPVQLAVDAPDARHVAVVGDFTGWDEHRVSLTRDPATGTWSTTVAVRPGRHVYAFVIDDTLWLRDPHAPVATDNDFGRPGSLLLVGHP